MIYERPLNVLYDHAIFARQSVGGISRYFSETIPRIADVGRYTDPRVAVSLFMGLHLNDYGLEHHRRSYRRFFGVHRRIRRSTYRLTMPFNDRFFRSFALGCRPEIYHSTTYKDCLPGDRRVKRVVTFYDLASERLPQFFPAQQDELNRDKDRAAARADHIICISESTRRDLLDLFNVPPEKTSVVHLANSLRARPATVRPLDEPYLLYVGARPDYKNFPALLEAYAARPALHRHVRLVCFGHPFRPDELEQAQRLGVADRLTQVGGDDAVLATWYGHAAAFVYPSLFEGFGIPVLEAMGCGCPVVASNVTSLPEVGGSAAVYFDPRSIDDMGATLERVLNDSQLRAKMVRDGREREREFSWDRAAAESIACYQAVAAR